MTRLALALLLVAGCSVEPFSKSCTQMDCNNGVQVDFTLRDRGSYVFELTLDGVKTTCRATLPLPKTSPNPCDRDNIHLGLSGSQLAEDQHALTGLKIQFNTPGQLQLRVTRDGTAIATLDRTITYTTTPGPNGPGCEPDECKSAKLTL